MELDDAPMGMASRAANDWMLQKTIVSTCLPVKARQTPS